ncbi:outer membrane protein assembly factor BamD [Mucilaginibacter koreensis]
MFKKQFVYIATLFIAFIIIVAGCKSKFEKLKASNNNPRKYQEAVRLYNKKDYGRALDLFENLAPHYRGQSGAEDLFYYYAYTNYKLKDYTSASYHFKQFAETYPTSPRAEECRFMNAYCYYLDAPGFSLDQSNTQKAIDAMQLFINLYPKSDRVTEANKIIQNLRDRLEEKAYANAKLYYTIGDYKSAVISMGNVLRDYPDTKYAEELEYLSIVSQYEYAKVSLEVRKEERYAQTSTMVDQFEEKYPSSTYLRNAQQYKRDSENGIVRVKRELAQLAAENPRKLAKEIAKQDTSADKIKPTQSSIDINEHQKIPPQE